MRGDPRTNADPRVLQAIAWSCDHWRAVRVGGGGDGTTFRTIAQALGTAVGLTRTLRLMHECTPPLVTKEKRYEVNHWDLTSAGHLLVRDLPDFVPTCFSCGDNPSVAEGDESKALKNPRCLECRHEAILANAEQERQHATYWRNVADEHERAAAELDQEADQLSSILAVSA